MTVVGGLPYHGLILQNMFTLWASTKKAFILISEFFLVESKSDLDFRRPSQENPR